MTASADEITLRYFIFNLLPAVPTLNSRSHIKVLLATNMVEVHSHWWPAGAAIHAWGGFNRIDTLFIPSGPDLHVSIGTRYFSAPMYDMVATCPRFLALTAIGLSTISVALVFIETTGILVACTPGAVFLHD